MRTEKPTNKPFMPDPASMDIADEKFQELADITVRLVEDCDLGNTSMCPALLVHFREFNEQFMPGDIQHAVIVLAGGMTDEDQKHETIKKVGRQCFDKQWFPVAVFMAAESWRSEKPDQYPQASKDPDRTECIAIAGRTISDDCKIMIMIPLGRDKDGNMVRDGENKVTREVEMYLLNHFFHGFFEKVAGKGSKDNDLRSR